MLLAKVDKDGSITAAAQALYYTPSAVSQQLLKFKNEVGQLPCPAARDDVQLTEEGTTPVVHARLESNGCRPPKQTPPK